MKIKNTQTIFPVIDKKVVDLFVKPMKEFYKKKELLNGERVKQELQKHSGAGEIHRNLSHAE